MTALHDLTALEAVDAMWRREVGPVELTEHYLDRIERLDVEVGAFVTRTFDSARERARAAEQQILAASDRSELPALHGLPTAIKDLTAVPVALSARNVSGKILRDVSFDIRRGEILGLTGLIGSGFDELPYALYGAQPATAGTIVIDGAARPLAKMSPPAALDAKLALLPSDRLGAAGVGNLTIAENMLLPVLQDFVRWFRLDWSEMSDRATKLGRQYDVRPNRPAQTLSSLSGGNAQKVLMAKWLQTSPRLLMLDEPTQGVDVGARQQLFAALDHAAADGTSILVASTDYEQLAQICDRVLIFARGQIVEVLEGAAISKDAIAERCLLSIGANAFSSVPEVAAA